MKTVCRPDGDRYLRDCRDRVRRTRGRVSKRIAADGVRLVSAATVLEAAMVLESRLREDGEAVLDLWLLRIEAEIVAVDADQANIARRAWRRYGKGRHPAGLNHGDCFSYALARSSGEALLFKGSDFSQTDVACA